MACMCGDSECPSCGEAQGTRTPDGRDEAYAKAMQPLADRDARLNAKAWEVFLRCVDGRTLDNLGVDDEATAAGARKRIAAIACNALEAAEIFVATVEE